MLDCESQNRAMKCKWIKNIKIEANKLEPNIWFTYLQSHCKGMVITDWLYCNMAPGDLRNYVWLDKRSIWYEVLYNWCDLNWEIATGTTSEIYNQSLWYNSHIKSKGKTLFLQSWYDKGVKYIKHIVQNGVFKSVVELEKEFVLKINIIDYKKLLNCIPGDWRAVIKEKQAVVEYIYNIETVKIESKVLYKMFVRKKTGIPDHFAIGW